MALPSVEYTPRDPGGSVLQQIVREHFETFRSEAAHLRDGEGLPRFVEEAAFARSATARHAIALAEAGVPGIPAVWMANAMHVRNIPGRKSDKNDATWISDLLALGLIRWQRVKSRG